MAKTPVSQEEIQLRKRARRRLVGAIALVLIVVVILPMVLDGEPRQRPQSINIQIPPIPAEVSGQGTAPTPPAASREGAAAAPQPAPAEATVGAPGPAPDVASPAPDVASPEPEPAPAARAPGEARAGNVAQSESLVIQIGCFSDAGKSRDLASRIKANRIPAFSESAPGREHSCTRVRAGPFSSQDAAQGARERLLELKLIPPPSEGKIVRRGD